MEKIRKFVSDHQETVVSVTQFVLCLIFMIATVAGATKQGKKGK